MMMTITMTAVAMVMEDLTVAMEDLMVAMVVPMVILVMAMELPVISSRITSRRLPHCHNSAELLSQLNRR
ncbi:MAG: hypothetical protein OI74_10885 [Gammaproteobacteria bacterium (ex Lamellibrachia satsuma)]|nr:MAG: hypothetical protein OI74_10885 [Gammaproteobacteria bacterium (ex Lamellibrachia satsuma)]RRS36733.1 MAG: hypothetical protein NV67_05350 [Gammaproteobacteria bacterium (ex Lamellibrachia satsuma)]